MAFVLVSELLNSLSAKSNFINFNPPIHPTFLPLLELLDIHIMVYRENWQYCRINIAAVYSVDRFLEFFKFFLKGGNVAYIRSHVTSKNTCYWDRILAATTSLYYS